MYIIWVRADGKGGVCNNHAKDKTWKIALGVPLLLILNAHVFLHLLTIFSDWGAGRHEINSINKCWRITLPAVMNSRKVNRDIFSRSGNVLEVSLHGCEAAGSTRSSYNTSHHVLCHYKWCLGTAFSRSSSSFVTHLYMYLCKLKTSNGTTVRMVSNSFCVVVTHCFHPSALT